MTGSVLEAGPRESTDLTPKLKPLWQSRSWFITSVTYLTMVVMAYLLCGPALIHHSIWSSAYDSQSWLGIGVLLVASVLVMLAWLDAVIAGTIATFLLISFVVTIYDHRALTVHSLWLVAYFATITPAALAAPFSIVWHIRSRKRS